MKTLFSLLLLLLVMNLKAQPSRNIFIITTDGFRWQELFTGADSLIINDTNFVKDTGLLKQLYWHSNTEERRKKLMPFFWSTIASQGQIYGNRKFGNKVNVKNLYNISYPGYNEIFTGFADPFITSNKPHYNKNQNVLEQLNNLQEFSGEVVAFSSWNIFPYIFNSRNGGVLVESGYHVSLTDSNHVVKQISDGVRNKTGTRHDMLTFFSAKEYIRENHPRVVVISLGETDEHAHAKRYDLYLQHANNFDNMLSQLWYYIQTDPFYKDITSILITTDHGRGAEHKNWSRHTMFAKGSGHIWLALLGKNIEALGEDKSAGKIFQNQFAATIAGFAGEEFKSNRKIGKKIALPHSSTAGSDIAEIALPLVR